MKAILIPIQPLDCGLISKRKKRVIVTKRKPTLETPFKCYIFETRHGGHSCKNCNQKDDCYAYAPNAGCYNGWGKVVGEFVCDKIEEFKKGEKGVSFKRFEALYETCLTVNEMRTYMGNSDKVYGWHISELKIYDKPKELGEFTVAQHEYGGKQAMRSYGGWKVKRVTNWCYVEEL